MSRPTPKYRTLRTTLSSACLGLLVASQTAWADMYRWVDKGGHVHYSDTLPARQSGRGYEIIDPATGEPIQTIAPAKTQAQLDAEAAERKAKAEHKAAAERQHKKDQVLLDLYSSVDDIKRSRDTQLDSIDRQITQLQGALKRAKARADDPKQPRAIRDDAQKDVRQMRQSIQELGAKRARVTRKYREMIQRFEQIKGAETHH